MAYSILSGTGDGVTDTFPINFTLGFISREHIKCRVGAEVDGLGNPVYRSLNWINDGLVQVLGGAPGNGIAYEFTRTVPLDALAHDYTNGEEIEEQNLDDSNKQAIMAVHQVLDGRFEEPFQQDLNLGGHKLTNVGDGVALTDAATMGQIGNAPAYAAAAAASASTATTQAGIATTQAGIATTGAGTATTQAGLAQGYAAQAAVSAYSGFYISAANVGGTANAITLAGLPTLVDGMVFRFVPKFTNTGPVTINGTQIKNPRNGNNLVADEIIVNKPIEVVFFNTQWHLTASGNIFIVDGSAAAPGYAFLNDQDTGVFRRTANVLSFAAAGSEFACGATDGFHIFGTAIAPAKLALYEQTTNGSNSLAIKPPSALAANRTQFFADRDGYIPAHPSEAIQFAAVTFDGIGTIESQTGPILSVTDTGVTATIRITLNGTFSKVFGVYSWKVPNRTSAYTVDQYAQGTIGGNSYVDIESQYYSGGAADLGRYTAIFILVT